MPFDHLVSNISLPYLRKFIGIDTSSAAGQNIIFEFKLSVLQYTHNSHSNSFDKHSLYTYPYSL